MRFRVVFTHKQIQTGDEVFVLERDLWNDHGYQCSFRLFHHQGGKATRLGDWKILDTREEVPGVTSLPDEFSSLPPSFISLAQTVESYEALRVLGPTKTREMLTALRDVVAAGVSPARLERIGGFSEALTRFAQAREALRRGPEVLAAIFHGVEPAPPAIASSIELQVTAQLEGFTLPHALTFSFGQAPIRRRIVLVGANGTGKTQLLAALARSVSGLEQADCRIVPKPPFVKVVALAYGAFDRFRRPRRDDRLISYVYCGLRALPGKTEDDRQMTLDVDGVIRRTAQTIVGLHQQRGSRHAAWIDAIEPLGLVLDSGAGLAAVERALTRLSAGEQLAVMTLTDLAFHLAPGSLVLLDEPETHLHPRLLASMLRSQQRLLDGFDSYAVLATHSLIPLQETLSSNVIVLERTGTQVRSRQPVTECFAGTLDDIQRDVFKVGEDDHNYLQLLDQLSSEDLERLAVKPGLGLRLALAARRST